MLVRTIALSRDFGRHSALSDVDLCLERGQVLGLLGPNGAGKTTCLRLLSGLLAPTSGRIEILGIDLTRHPLAAKRHLGYLPERPPLYPELRVDEYLIHCAQLHRLPRRTIPAAIATAKRRCGLEDQGRRLIATLSKGYRQRLGLAQAILHRPPLLILDEPTEGLDPVQMRELRQLIRELAQDTGIILSSHLLPEVQSVCDRVMILHQGRVRFAAETRAVGSTTRWRVRLGGETHVMHLNDLAPVAGALAIGPNQFQVDLQPDATSADLARAIQQAGLDLFELVPERSDLERTFFDLIGAEEPT
ncbi:MAG: ABC transporter ATP-binding protein [Thermochromatium sp.]